MGGRISPPKANFQQLLRVSSLFVKQVEVRDNDKEGVSLYGFSEKPDQLSVEAKWSSSKFVTVGSCSHKGISLWLNKGSRIRIKWEAQTSILNQLEVSLIKGVSVIIICLILKSLGACDDESYAEERPVSREVTETDPIMPQKEVRSIYGTYEEEANSSRSSSSEDLYDGKICVICYDNPRNCFFVPCGHCATCQECAQRIVDVESRVFPVCRRPIHKVRKLIIP
ncbi:hypothetical protein K7X08_013780 [Anisodus acutangulus]|uniref:RING-type domain-containing protein n=1 Tax=Anisodus acutangulus TaxID=402998 RepID=A0A9Q1R2G7_9SOLA|nr:hypothetical protein K7X08_013780 [Anisodus acutangulus]